ncbi:MAG: hypothetical protein Hyperionvirus21_11 [Hyperionvirus sp.]|uniref:Uncharacterized protein n=1 Tax=Hyperionvirus sp. TaxID=2487770 RepID=A0A3G5AAM7_9VIRU|nr:MAG: hypothetical protein Hyperionvirus21_11 [Hyperionvirus sp.]
MGREIDIVEVAGKKKVRVIQSEYVECDFGRNPECRRYWDLGEDMDGFDGVRVSQKLVKVIDQMLEDGIKIGEYDGEGDNDTDMLPAFMDHMYRFLKIAEDNPGAYFISDINLNKDIILPNGEKCSLKEPKKFPILYYGEHPILGMCEIKTYGDAMDMVKVAKHHGDEVNAAKWAVLAESLERDDDYDEGDSGDDE